MCERWMQKIPTDVRHTLCCRALGTWRVTRMQFLLIILTGDVPHASHATHRTKEVRSRCKHPPYLVAKFRKNVISREYYGSCQELLTVVRRSVWVLQSGAARRKWSGLLPQGADISESDAGPLIVKRNCDRLKRYDRPPSDHSAYPKPSHSHLFWPIRQHLGNKRFATLLTSSTVTEHTFNP
jgi:hypothetical protein